MQHAQPHYPKRIVESTYSRVSRLISEPEWLLFQPLIDAIQGLKKQRNALANIRDCLESMTPAIELEAGLARRARKGVVRMLEMSHAG